METDPTDEAKDDAVAKKLWDMSVDLVKLDESEIYSKLRWETLDSFANFGFNISFFVRIYMRVMYFQVIFWFYVGFCLWPNDNVKVKILLSL